jgi:hypothetical protein
MSASRGVGRICTALVCTERHLCPIDIIVVFVHVRSIKRRRVPMRALSSNLRCIQALWTDSALISFNTLTAWKQDIFNRFIQRFIDYLAETKETKIFFGRYEREILGLRFKLYVFERNKEVIVFVSCIQDLDGDNDDDHPGGGLHLERCHLWDEITPDIFNPTDNTDDTVAEIVGSHELQSNYEYLAMYNIMEMLSVLDGINRGNAKCRPKSF